MIDQETVHDGLNAIYRELARANALNSLRLMFDEGLIDRLEYREKLSEFYKNYFKNE